MNETASETRFTKLAAGAIEAFCATHPTDATMLGNHDFDDRLDDPSQTAANRRASELGRLLKELDALTELDAADSVDYEMLRNEANRELFCLTELDEPSWDATLHDPGRAIHQLLVQDFAPLDDRLSSLAGRLRMVRDYLAAARQRLTDPSAMHVRMAIAQLGVRPADAAPALDRPASARHPAQLRLATGRSAADAARLSGLASGLASGAGEPTGQRTQLGS